MSVDITESKGKFTMCSHDALSFIAYDPSLSPRIRVECYLIMKHDYRDDHRFTETNGQIARSLRLNINTVSSAIREILKSPFWIKEEHEKNKKKRVLRWGLSAENYSRLEKSRLNLNAKITFESKRNSEKITFESKRIPSILVLDQKLYNTPISSFTPKKAHPNPLTLPSERAYEGFSVEQVIGLVLKNMGLTESEYNRRKSDGTLTEDQLIHERLLQNERVVVGGKVRRFPLHLRKVGK